MVIHAEAVWLQSDELAHYLDNLCDYTVVESETTGHWSDGEQLIFSIAGNSYRQNAYWWNNMRVDSRMQTGSTLLHTSLANYSLDLDYYRGELWLNADSVQVPQLSLTGNIGNLGGISPGSQQLINVHLTAIQRVWDKRPETMRKHIEGAGTLEATWQNHHVYFTYGRRRLTAFDQTGITTLYPADYMRAQLDGKQGRFRYFLTMQTRDDYLSEFLFNQNEVAKLGAVMAGASFTPYQNAEQELTIGLSYGLTNTRRDSLNFCRNIVDQDGEAFFPYYTTGLTNELNLSVLYRQQFFRWLQLELRSYNSLVHFTPDYRTWTTTLYAQTMNAPSASPLYQVTWSSTPVLGGLLENEVNLNFSHELANGLTGEASIGLSIDGMLSRDCQVLSPNLTAHLALDWHPVYWFNGKIALSHHRMRYTLDDLWYFSPTYLANNINGDAPGGILPPATRKAHWYQPSYAVFDLPIRFLPDKENRHEIAILSQARIYYNQWMEAPTSGWVNAFMAQHPTYLSNLIRYTYRGKRWFVSLSWQSYEMAGSSLLGNGPLSNNVGVQGRAVSSGGRLDQDRAYIARIQVTCNPIKYFSAAISLKYKDGHAFTSFVVDEAAIASGSAATSPYIKPNSTQGINLITGVFGKREDSFFNIDLRVTGRWWCGKDGVPMELEAMCYNIYDFGTELTEYTFNDDTRTPMSLCIPRGLLFTLRVGLQ